MPARARLSLTVLAVEDVSRSARFYETAFGWRRQVDLVPVFVEYEHGSDASGLALYARGRFAEMAGATVGSAAPGTCVSAELYVIVDDLDAAIAALAAAGARPLSPRSVRPWGDEAAYFADPDGHVVAVALPPAEDR
jgi:catechol 2,3-dioxygenase-like lactoylglutathione lyase family enzyme